MKARRRRRGYGYRTEAKILEEIRIWLPRRHGPAPLIECSDGVTRPRWTPRYVRRVILSELDALRMRRGA